MGTVLKYAVLTNQWVTVLKNLKLKSQHEDWINSIRVSFLKILRFVLQDLDITSVCFKGGMLKGKLTRTFWLILH